jgi:hypothetical protein
MTRSFLAALITLGLLASGDPCAWLCETAAEPVSAAATSSHCGGAATERGPSGEEAPSHDDCAGCTVSAAVASGSVEGPATGGALELAVVRLALLGAGPVVLAARSSTRAERSPPRDVLSITSTLRL